MDAFEIAWFSSAFAFAYFVYASQPFEPPARPKDSLIPIKANGRDICVPPMFVDVISDISKFATKFELALKKAVPELKSSSGTLWTARIVRGKKPELEKALQGMDRYTPFFAEMLRGVDLSFYSLRRDYSALLDRAIDAYDRGAEVEGDLKSYRKRQQVKMSEVQVGLRRSTWIFCVVLNEFSIGAYEGVLAQ